MTYPKRKKHVRVERGLFKLSLTNTIGQPDRPLGAAPRNRHDRMSRDQFHKPLFYFARDSIVVTTRGTNDLPGLEVVCVQRKETALDQFTEGAKDGRRKFAQTLGAVDAFQAAHQRL
jgi:hypothetical protein